MCWPYDTVLTIAFEVFRLLFFTLDSCHGIDMLNDAPTSGRIRSVQTPVIPFVQDLVTANPGTIPLGQGVVHFPPPTEAIQQLREFGGDPDHHLYGPLEGIEPLQVAIRQKLQRENALDLDDSAIVVTAGSNMAFLQALLTVADPGDEIILFLPYYFNQEMAIRMVNCVPVFVPTDAQHQPDVGALERAITPRTRVVVTVSPNNPTGAVYPETTLRQINRLCALRGIYHFSDEAYEYFTYADVPHFSPGSIHGAYRHTISFFSLSKSFGFAGWRVGYVVLPEHLLLSMRKVQDTNLICAAMPSQYAAIGALRAGYAYTAKWMPDLRRVRDTVLMRLAELGSRVSVVETSGAFYAFARINDTQMSDLELVRWLVEVHQVAVVPGSAFGCDEGCWLRISYGALRPESVIAGIGRLTKGLQAIPA